MMHKSAWKLIYSTIAGQSSNLKTQSIKWKLEHWMDNYLLNKVCTLQVLNYYFLSFYALDVAQLTSRTYTYSTKVNTEFKR